MLQPGQCAFINNEKNFHLNPRNDFKLISFKTTNPEFPGYLCIDLDKIKTEGVRLVEDACCNKKIARLKLGKIFYKLVSFWNESSILACFQKTSEPIWMNFSVNMLPGAGMLNASKNPKYRTVQKNYTIFQAIRYAKKPSGKSGKS